MTDDTNTPDDAAKTDDGDAEGPKQLREALKREKAENKQLRTQLLGTAYTKVGLDPEKGLGKAIAKEYKGAPTAAALAEFAKAEYDWEVPTEPDNPDAQTITDEQAKLDEANRVSTPKVPLDEAKAFQKANADGDLVTAGAIKAKRLRDLMG